MYFVFCINSIVNYLVYNLCGQAGYPVLKMFVEIRVKL